MNVSPLTVLRTLGGHRSGRSCPDLHPASPSHRKESTLTVRLADLHNLSVQRAFFARYRSLPFDDSAAETYGRIRGDLESRGTPIGAMDLLIAAIGLANNLTVVTHNLREFSRIAGLRTVDWEE